MNLLARTLMADGKADQASELLERANMLSPFNPERLVLLGDAFFSVGKNEKAAAYYTKAMAVDQHDHDAKAGLARVKLKDGDVNAALEIINSGLSEEEGVSLFNNAAVRAAQTGQLEVSLKLYESALKAVKSSTLKATVQFNIALAYERLGRLEEAGAALARCMKLAPTFDKGKQLQKRLSRRAAS
jgi:tetratricopeptide (TPR) repeat protein